MNPDITELKALYLLLADDELLRRCSSGTLTGQAQLVAETEVLARGLALPTGRSFSSPDLEDHKYRGDLEINETAIDARPVLPVSQDSLWDHAAKKRDNIASIIDSEFKQQNITAWIRKSQPGEYPLYVLVDIWIPKGETSQSATLDRSFLKVIISVAPCRIHSLIYKVELKRQGRTINGEHWKLDDEELRELAAFLVKGGLWKKPKFFKSRFSILGNLMENKLIPEAKPNFALIGSNSKPWSIGLGLVLVAISVFTASISILLIGMIILSLGWFFLWLETIDVVPKRSIRSPRREFRVDSWHVSVPGAGEQFEQFRQRLYNVIKIKESTIEMNIELHQNFTNSRGCEERERLVLIKGQTTLHVHIYPFVNDAFVGWESYLNWNCWTETAPVSTTVRNGKKFNYRSLEVGVYIPTDFDLIEADVLAETTHRIIVDEVKAFLKEKEIEADLDFKIIRGDRTNALKEGKDKKDKWLE